MNRHLLEKKMANNPVNWFEIYVQDMNKAKEFYSGVLGTEFSPIEGPDGEMCAFPMDQDSAGASGALVKMPNVPSGGNSTLVYFSCTDCGVEASRVAAAGGKVVREKMSIGEYGFIALASDPDGNMFGLHSMA
jgi:predicted enzyme related to lactoylglutathione lyase